jgi:polar amino acid transport system permease protein
VAGTKGRFIVDLIYAFFARLYTNYGINLPIIYDAYDRGRFVSGLLMTIWLSVVTIALSLVIGAIGAWLQSVNHPLLRSVVSGYIQFFRNTPPLIQLYFFFFAVGAYMPLSVNAFGQPVPLIGNVAWAVISLSFFAGAFNVEIFRSGIDAVPKATIEAAESLGYTPAQIFLYVAFPLALRFCLPALTNNLVNLVKTTTLAYAIAVPELIYVSAQIWSDSLNVREMMNVLLIVYLVIVGVLVLFMLRLERSLRVPGFGKQVAR